jgi:hypothetical protein
MATITADAALSQSAFRPPTGGILGVREAVYTSTAALALNDVIQMVPMAKNERAVGGQLIVETDLDTNGAPAIVLSVGDGVDTDRYISSTTIAQTGGVVNWGLNIDTAAEAATYNYKYPAADTIDILVNTAAATPVAVGTIRLRVFVVAA